MKNKAARSIKRYRRKEVASRRLRGMSNAAIHQSLIEDGIVGPSGKPWALSTITNDLYALEQESIVSAKADTDVLVQHSIGILLKAQDEALQAIEDGEITKSGDRIVHIKAIEALLKANESLRRLMGLDKKQQSVETENMEVLKSRIRSVIDAPVPTEDK